MSIDQQTNPYDETYYRVGCGAPYERNEHWLTFFGKIADAIVREINPTSVLDAGCAMGFLVEALRERGVEAYGVDISEYAISQVADAVKPYCWVGSLTEPLPRRYDLVVTIETLEHLHAHDLPTAIANLCAASDDILMSSTPDDYGETTHFSVQQPEMWASEFAAQGFWHDVEFDASFITPWAMRLRKRSEPAHRTLIPLERALWSLRKENTALREMANALRDMPSQPTRQELEAHIGQLETKLAQLEAQSAQNSQPDPYWSLMQQAFDTANSANHADALRRELIELTSEHHRLQAEVAANATQLAQLLYQRNLLESRLSFKMYHRTLRTVEVILPEGSIRSRAWRRVSRTLKGQRRVAAPKLKPVKQIESDEADVVEESDELPYPVIAARSAVSMPYSEWVRLASPSLAELDLGKREVVKLAYQPVISLITPVFDPPLNAIRDAIESVLAQIYEGWELCLVDGGSKNPAVRKLLDMYAQRDPRIKVKMLDKNLGISGNTNEAARLATGDFVEILDHDDKLAPHALFEVVKALNADPTLDVLYFDEDKLTADGSRREDPFFKPDWSPEMLLSANYLTHCVIRRSLYEAVGGCDPEMDGTQDWDLVFKITERTPRIHHIPQVLYHWRRAPGSAATTERAKPYVFDRQLRAVTQHLERIGVAQPTATFTEHPLVPQLRVTWPVKDELVSIIIPTKDKLHLLKRCIDTLTAKTTYRNFEIILVDTGSVEKRTLAYYNALKANPQLQGRFKVVEYTGQFNYSRANNVGVAQSNGSLLLFLNNDTEIIQPDWLEEMVRWAQRPEIGIVGAKLLFPSGYIQHAGVVMGIGGHAGHVFSGLDSYAGTMFGFVDWYRDYMAVTGACMMTRRDVYDRVGGFDEDYLIILSDVQFCLRAREEGFRTLYSPYVCLKHHESASRGNRNPVRDVQRAYEHMYKIVNEGDPYYNENLATDVSVPKLALNDAPERAARLRRVVREFEYYFRD